jgi:hypothetical protein
LKLSLIALTVILLIINFQFLLKRIKNPNEYYEVRDELTNIRSIYSDKLVDIVSIIASSIILLFLFGYVKSVIPYFNNNKVTILSIIILLFSLMENIEVVYSAKTHKDFKFKNNFYEMIAGCYSIFYYIFMFVSLLKR